MDKYESETNDFGSSQPSKQTTPSKGCKPKIGDIAIEHSSKGEYTSTNRPRGGGHGQDAIDYMNANNIPYEITTEYNNGVRRGNLPTSKEAMKRFGERQSWFPKSWTAKDIENAGIEVAESLEKCPKSGQRVTRIVNGVSVTIIFGDEGSIETIFPSKKQPGGKKK